MSAFRFRIVIHTRRGIDDRIAPDARARVDDAAGHDDRAVADLDFARDRRPGVNDGRKAVAVLQQPRRHFHARAVLADADDADGCFGTAREQLFAAANDGVPH